MTTTVTSVRVWATVQTLLLVLLVVAVLALAFFSMRTHDALCSFRGDLDRRAEQLYAYLLDVSAGKKPLISGFTYEELERSYFNQKATLESLSNLNCG